jgi:APA family basic amino acid/polyamine antiporter
MSEGGGELERNLGFLEAMTLGGGTMIGAGIFVLPGVAAENAGPASSVSFAIAGVVALLAALSLSELATAMPVAGGSYHYVNRALGGLFGSIVGWGMWTGLMFASAFYMIGFGQYIVAPIPFLDGRAMVIMLGLLGLGLLVGINYYGTEESSRLQNVMIGTETAIVLVFVLVGLFFIDPANLDPFAPTGTAGILATTGIVFVSFLGFEIIATVAGEIRDPGRTIPLTMVLSVTLVTLLYVLVMLVSTGVVPAEALGESLVPVSDVAVVYLGSVGVVGIVFAAVIAAISSSNSSILAASRVIYAMGRDGIMTDWLNESHDRFRTPHRAVVTTGAVTAALVLLGLRVDAIVALLAQVASFSFLVAYALVHVALVVFRRAEPAEYDPEWTLPGVLYPLVPVAGVLCTALVISQMDIGVIAIGTGIVGLGVGWFGWYGRSRDPEPGLVNRAFGGRPANPYRVVVPIANPETQGNLLRLAAICAQDDATDGIPAVLAVNVLPIAARSPNQNVAAERLDSQRDLMSAATDLGSGLAVDVETRALVGPGVDDSIIRLLAAEGADHVVMGWDANSDGDHVFGSTLDPILRYAHCEVTLVDTRSDGWGDVVALVGQGPNSSLAVRRARQIAGLTGGDLSLVTVVPADGEPTESRRAAGERRIADAAADAGLGQEGYETVVLSVGDETDVVPAILDSLRGAGTVCVGATEERGPAGLAYGSVAARVGREATCTVVTVRAARSVQSDVDGLEGQDVETEHPPDG